MDWLRGPSNGRYTDICSISSIIQRQRHVISVTISSGDHKSLATNVQVCVTVVVRFLQNGFVTARSASNSELSPLYQTGLFWRTIACKYVAHRQCLDVLTISCQEQQGLRHSLPIYLLAQDKHEQRRWIRSIELHRKRAEAAMGHGNNNNKSEQQ